MKRIYNKNKNITRQDLANPFRNMSYHERLVHAGIVNIKNNSIVEDLGNGYEKVKIINESKFVK
ncbi:hypothetical protein AGE29_03670 [Clostridium botulinum]|uniref:Uncharacterized protein n=1 Tax=Clostridium botulinum TaxID=1491 RepID=A0A846HZP7_CLOBO|nr:hypothetical protein AGE29_03670 [Clostridium botulinum]NEZ92672.1 hypothetical protein [Clostridium botulinum]